MNVATLARKPLPGARRDRTTAHFARRSPSDWCLSIRPYPSSGGRTVPPCIVTCDSQWLTGLSHLWNFVDIHAQRDSLMRRHVTWYTTTKTTTLHLTTILLLGRVVLIVGLLEDDFESLNECIYVRHTLVFGENGLVSERTFVDGLLDCAPALKLLSKLLQLREFGARDCRKQLGPCPLGPRSGVSLAEQVETSLTSRVDNQYWSLKAHCINIALLTMKGPSKISATPYSSPRISSGRVADQAAKPLTVASKSSGLPPCL